MKNLTIATAIATGLSAAVVGLAAPALAAPTAGSNAEDTISELEAEGNRVIVNRLSDAPLSDASIVGVQPGPDIRGQVWDYRHNDRYQHVITGKVYYVTVR